MNKNESSYFEIFPWHKNFETDIAIIDEQHKKLVDILNQLAAHLANRATPIVLNEIFDELAEYANYHFKTEEKIWNKYFKDDIWLTEHEKTHESFFKKVIELKNDQSGASLDNIIQDLVSFLTRWLAYHILDTDKRMSKAVIAIQSGVSLGNAKIQAEEEMAGSMQVLIDTVLTMYDSLSSRTLDLMREKSLRKQAEDALKESEERWQFILGSGSDGIWDWDIEQGISNFAENNSLGIQNINQSLEKINRPSNVHKDDIKEIQSALRAHLDGETEFYLNKHRVTQKNGGWHWVYSRGKVVSRDKDGKALRMVGTHTDITSQELAMLVYNNSNQGMFATDTQNNIIGINPAFSRITGYTEDEALGSNPKFLSSGRQNEGFYKELWEALNKTGYWKGEIWNKRKNGEVFPELLTITSITNADGDIDHRVALFTDITEKKKADSLIFKQANYDELTLLPNRRMLNDRLTHEIKKSQRSKKYLAVLFIDLDHFKEVNDTFGHTKGDDLLIKVAQRIVDQVREFDTVSRLGGDEFTVLLSDIENTHSVSRIAQDIINSLETVFQLEDKQAFVSASIGISVYPNDAATPDGLLKNADQAMYLAKRSGRSCFRYFTPSMQEETQKRLDLIVDLRKAVENNQFQLYYQPIIDLSTQEIHKAEALIRWNHPDKGIVSPANFIPLSEETGLINPIGDWVFKEATYQVSLWKKAGYKIQISINKSPVQFESNNTNEEWLAHLKTLNLSGHDCVIEITEGLLMDTKQDIINQLLQFRDSGVEVALDDFGTGYSSLSYLKKFDIDYVKIDQSFVRNLAPNSQDLILCEAIIVMAHKLNLMVIAEGIETPSQCELLSKMGCDFGQGYYFSPPVPAYDFDKLLSR